MRVMQEQMDPGRLCLPMRSALMYLSCLLAGSCATAPSAEVKEPRPPSALPSAPVPLDPDVDDPCHEHDDPWVQIPNVDAVCKEDGQFWPGSCVARIDVLVHNCSHADVSVAGMTLQMDGDAQIHWEYEDELVAPGQTWSPEGVVVPPSGQFTMQIHLLLDGQQSDTLEVDFQVTNTTMDDARQACQDCSGDWGPHGMLGTVGCLCRTTDAGTPCDDGNDCEGQCISVDGQFVCSEFFTVFGCHSYLPPGWSEEPHPELVKAPHVCVD